MAHGTRILGFKSHEMGGRSQPLSIASKELIPIILACAVWDHQWWGHQVVCNCNNQVVVACLHTRTSKHKGPMHLLRCLVFVEAHFKCHIYLAYINTHLNHLADDLSRNNLLSFPIKGARSRQGPISCIRPPPGSPTGPSSQLDLSDLAPSVQCYFQQ